MKNYNLWLKNLKYLKNKSEFLTSESFEIQKWLVLLIDFIEKDKIAYTVDKYGYYMWIHFPQKDRIVYNRNYGLNNFSLIKKWYEDKVITWKILQDNNILTPETYLIIHPKSIFSRSFNWLSGALEFGEKVWYPLIRKPLDWKQWIWVEKIFSVSQLEDQFKKYNSWELKWHQILQPFVAWKDIRIIFLAWKIELAYERTGVKITWDWKTSIKNLIENLAKNAWTETQKYKQFVKDEGYNLEDILENWVQISVMPTANVSQGWGVKKYKTNQKEFEFVKKINDIFWATITGFDILTTSTLDKWVVLELNSFPGFKGASQIEENFEKKITWKMRQVIKKQEWL